MLPNRKTDLRGKNSKILCAVYEDSAIADSNVRKLFTNFRSGNFEMLH